MSSSREFQSFKAQYLNIGLPQFFDTFGRWTFSVTLLQISEKDCLLPRQTCESVE